MAESNGTGLYTPTVSSPLRQQVSAPDTPPLAATHQQETPAATTQKPVTGTAVTSDRDSSKPSTPTNSRAQVESGRRRPFGSKTLPPSVNTTPSTPTPGPEVYTDPSGAKFIVIDGERRMLAGKRLPGSTQGGKHPSVAIGGKHQSMALGGKHPSVAVRGKHLSLATAGSKRLPTAALGRSVRVGEHSEDEDMEDLDGEADEQEDDSSYETSEYHDDEEDDDSDEWRGD